MCPRVRTVRLFLCVLLWTSCSDSLTQICCFLRHREGKTEEEKRVKNRKQGALISLFYPLCTESFYNLSTMNMKSTGRVEYIKAERNRAAKSVRDIKFSTDCLLFLWLLVSSVSNFLFILWRQFAEVWSIYVVCFCAVVLMHMLKDSERTETWLISPLLFEDFGVEGLWAHMYHTPQRENNVSGLWKLTVEATQTELLCRKRAWTFGSEFVKQHRIDSHWLWR